MDLSTAVAPSSSGLGRIVDPSVAFSTRTVAPFADSVGCAGVSLGPKGFITNALSTLAGSKKRKGDLTDPKP